MIIYLTLFKSVCYKYPKIVAYFVKNTLKKWDRKGKRLEREKKKKQSFQNLLFGPKDWLFRGPKREAICHLQLSYMVLPSFCDHRRPSLYAKMEEARRRREESKGR